MRIKKKHFLLGALICLLILFSMACETSFPEWSGQMANESGTHQSPENVNQKAADAPNNQAIKPAGWTGKSFALPAIR